PSRARRRSPHLRRVPRPSGHWPGLRRRGRARRSPHARQDVAHLARRARRLRGDRVAVRGHSLPLAPRRALDLAGGSRGERVDGRGRDHGPPPSRARRRRRAVPPREHPDARGNAPRRQLGRAGDGAPARSLHWRARASPARGGRIMSAEFGRVLGRLLAREANAPIGAAEVRDAFDAILSGAWTPVQIGAFAVALRMAGETAEVIAGAAGAMRAAMAVVDHDFPLVVDTCGTGGDGSHTLNISTGAAVVVAACGLPVAKHGNRSASSRCGSADVFEALGIPLDVPIARQGHVLREAGIAFLFAPAPNPARATHQLLGVYDDALRPILAHALGCLGGVRAWVVHSEDGLDEVSPCAPTRVSELTASGDVREFVIAPEDFGIERIPRAALAGADAATNARELRAILAGESHVARDAVLLNAPAALAVATGDEPRACTTRARAALEGGAA